MKAGPADVVDTVDAIVIGAGVVGLATARALLLAGHETLVLERESLFGTGSSSRNSEVIHAGIYYPPGSAKARLCIAGRALLYEFAEAHGVAHRRCGKLLVANDDEDRARLDRIAHGAAASGVADLQWLNAEAVGEMEPALRCIGAYLSPSTGIIDSHGFMLALVGDIEQAGGMIAYGAPVEGWHAGPDGIVIETGGRESTRVRARLVVNAAGHGAPPLVRRLTGYPADRPVAQYFAKGSYFSLQGVKPPFSRLVYPAPGAASLGVHATIDLGGRVRFGPDIEWVSDEHQLTVDPERGSVFYAAIRRYWPDLPDGALMPDYAGIRSKIHAPDRPMPDFRIEGPAEHGIAGLVNLLGIESPGLTASLAIADAVVRELE